MFELLAFETQRAGMGAWPSILLSLYCLTIMTASLGGGMLPALMQLTHRRMQLLVSLIAGLMLGVGLFHMLPQAIIETSNVDGCALAMTLGLLTMFFLIRAFHFHHHGPAADPTGRDIPAALCPHEAGLAITSPPVGGLPPPEPTHHDAACDHDTHASPLHGHVPSSRPVAEEQGLQTTPSHSGTASPGGHRDEPGHARHSHRWAWVGALFGLSIHSLIDGIALAASVQSEGLQRDGWWLGTGTFIAVVLHKPLDAVSIGSLMAAGGWPASWRQLVNAGFAVLVPVGAAAFTVGSVWLGSGQHAVVGFALAFSAGVFLCISLGDLLPELEFHSHDRLALSGALVAGVVLAYLIRLVEPTHTHQRRSLSAQVESTRAPGPCSFSRVARPESPESSKGVVCAITNLVADDCTPTRSVSEGALPRPVADEGEKWDWLRLRCLSHFSPPRKGTGTADGASPRYPERE